MSIHKRGDRWQLKWREGGRQRSMTFDRKGDAQAYDVKRRRRAQLGMPTLDAGNVTLAEFVETWWELHAEPNLEENTRRNYETVWDRHILDRLGGYRLRDLSPRVIEGFRVELARDGVGQPTIRKAMGIVQSVLGKAVLWEAIAANPVVSVPKPKITTSARRPVPPATVEAIRSGLKPRDKTLVSLLAYAGLRPEEALALQWGDVRTRTLVIERAVTFGENKTTKTRHARTVKLLGPLAQDLAEWRMLRGRPATDALLFPRRDDTPWHDADYRNWRRRVYQPAAEAAGLDDRRPYTLRGSFVSLLIFEGQTVIEVAAQAGHSPQTCLRHYANLFAEYSPDDRVPAEQAIRDARDIDKGTSKKGSA